MRVALYTPTPKGWVSQRTANTTLMDAAWCREQGYECIDMAEHVRPGNSIEVGRNVAVQRAFNLDCTHLRMLDADVSRPWGQPLLPHLFAAMDATGAVPAAAVVDVHGGRPGKLNVRPASDEPVFEPDVVSAAAMLIDLNALLRAPWPAKTPHFARQYNPGMTHCTMDEGYFFSGTLRDIGVMVVACNVRMRHSCETV